MYFQAIGRLFGMDSAIISSKARLAEQPFNLIGRRPFLSKEKRMDRGFGPRTESDNVLGTP
jgi:acetyl-CoA carboxylase alpha subunit